MHYRHQLAISLSKFSNTNAYREPLEEYDLTIEMLRGKLDRSKDDLECDRLRKRIREITDEQQLFKLHGGRKKR